MPDHLVIAQPGVDEFLPTVRAAWPGARFTVADPVPGWTAPADTTVLFTDALPANAESLPALTWIQLGSHGYAQLNGVALPRETVVTNASGVQDRPIAEWVVMMLLALGRRLPDMLAAQRDHRWDRSPVFQSELRGMRVGLLGFGNIGREVARLLVPLGLPFWVMTRSHNRTRGERFDPLDHSPDSVPEPERWFTMDEREEFYRGIDALVVAVPDSAATRGLVDATALELLPRGALVLNPARARVVDEDALLDAVRSGHLGGAALDDHYRQPMPPDDPFWDAPNTIVTAHISGSGHSTHFQHRIWDLFQENAVRRAAGQTMLNVIARSDLELAE